MRKGNKNILLLIISLLIKFISFANMAFQAVQADFVQRCEQAKTLANSLKTDVLENLRELIKSQNIEFKRVLNDGRKIEKDLKNNMDQVEKVLLIKIKFIFRI